MKWFSNLPDNQHVPYQFIKAEPHIKEVFQSFRGSEYLTTLSFLSFPGLLWAWEKRSPSLHPRNKKLVWLVQIPFFLTAGALFSYQRVLYRFWGWSENSDLIDKQQGEVLKTKWSDVDW